MLYAEIVANSIILYPLTVYQIRGMYPGPSWPDNPDVDALAFYNLYMVYETPQPTNLLRNQVLSEGTPVFNTETNQWEQVWVVTGTNINDAKKCEKNLLAEKRYEHEIKGIKWQYQVDENTSEEVIINTDRDSQAKMLAAYVLAIGGNWKPGKKWKFGDNKFKVMTGQQVAAMALAASDHVQGCFDMEDEISTAIENSTNLEEVEAWSWELSSN